MIPLGEPRYKRGATLAPRPESKLPRRIVLRSTRSADSPPEWHRGLTPLLGWDNPSAAQALRKSPSAPLLHRHYLHQEALKELPRERDLAPKRRRHAEPFEDLSLVRSEGTEFGSLFQLNQEGFEQLPRD